MKRSSDVPTRETELDRSIDETAQMVVEAECDWRKPYYSRVKKRDWSTIKRCGEA